jgi:hypothetical protein
MRMADPMHCSRVRVQAQPGREAGGEEGKRFFFEKKTQKTFTIPLPQHPSPFPMALAARNSQETKVFWSFFSKKDCLPYPSHPATFLP